MQIERERERGKEWAKFRGYILQLGRTIILVNREKDRREGEREGRERN